MHFFAMDETLQQTLALGIVILAVIAELVRRYRKKKVGKPGCDGCDSGVGQQLTANGETKLKFYRKGG
jgi:hypothetical protein